MSAPSSDQIALSPAGGGARSRCITTHPIPELGTFLLDARPTATVLVDAAKGERCDECLVELEGKLEARECSKCKEDHYCGATCQEKAWDRHHRLLCQQLPAIAHKLRILKLDEPDRLDAILLARLASEHFADQTPSQMLLDHPAFSADTTTLDLPPPLLFLSLLSTETTSSTLPTLLAPHLPSHLTASELTLLLSRFGRNNHVLVAPSDRLEPIAHAVLARVSRAVNHACAPSAVMSCSWVEDGEIRVGVRTIRSLQEGEEITIPYLDPLLSTQTRQEMLSRIYSFHCNCPLCISSPSGGPLRLPAIPTPSRSPPASAHHLTHLQTPRYPTTIPPPTRAAPISEAKVARMTSLFEDAHASGRWRDAAEAGERVLQVYWAGYGPWWPLIGTHLLSLARIALNRAVLLPPQDPQGRTHLLQGVMFARWARAVLAVVWGAEGDAVERALSRVESGLEAELAGEGVGGGG